MDTIIYRSELGNTRKWIAPETIN